MCMKIIPLKRQCYMYIAKMGFTGVYMYNLGPRPLGPKEIDGLFVPPGKAYLKP